MFKWGLKLWSPNTGEYRNEAMRLFNSGLIHYVELYVVPNTMDTLSIWRDTPIPFAIHAPHFAHGFNLAQPDKEAYNRLLFDQVRCFADELDAMFIVIHGGIDGHINETARQIQGLQDSRLLLENKPAKALANKMGGEWCRGSTPEEVAYVMAATGCGHCLDIGHAVCAANYRSENPITIIDSFLSLNPASIHLSDNEWAGIWDQHRHFGDGDYPIATLLKKLPRGIPLAIETVKSHAAHLNDFELDVRYLMWCLRQEEIQNDAQ